MEWSEELSSGLLRAAPDAILVMDAAGLIVLVNDRAEEVFGRPRADLVGRPARSLLAGPFVMDDSRVHAVQARKPDGTRFPIEASLARVDTPQGRVTVAVVRDCTELQRATDEQTRLRQEAHAHRAHRLESLGQLAGGVAHDFNNMLGVIVNYANFVIEEAAAEQPDLKTIADDARQVVRAGERATELTHQLLAFARREVVRPEVLDVNEVLDAAAETVRTTVGPAISVLVRPGAGLPSVTCDPGQIEQLLANLAANARDAMPDGGELEIETARETVGGGHAELDPGEYVRLRIRDSGVGMTADVAERAFEPFFTTKGSGEGPGLGLATVYGIVTQAGGAVSLSSSPGAGTTVTVLLPAGAAVGSTVAPVSAEPASSPSTGGHGETLLVVEDEAALRDVAGRILSGAGYHVLTADGGPSALELAARHEGEIDLLLSDVVMPGMLGKELAERLTVVRPGTRVLYMSGYAQPVLASEGTLDPGVALLEKPFTSGDLLSAVRKRLDG